MSHKAPKENLSGHVCFDVPRTRFFQEIHEKAHKLELRRRAGLLPYKKARNPINAEKSPRTIETFDYKPPPAVPVPERWVYPEGDWGLMAKFRSQKPIYDKIWAKEAEYQTQVDRVAKIREENQRMIQAEFDRQKSLYDVAKKEREEADQRRFNAIMSVDLSTQNSGHSAGYHQNHGPDELDLALARDARAAAAAEAERIRKKKDHSGLMTLIKESTPPTDFYHTKISTFRNIGDKHPEVLAEWRAKRGAEFVSENARTLEVPKARVQERSFRPGGILPAKPAVFSFAKEVPKKKAPPKPLLEPIDPAALDLTVLKKQLQETEEQMQRQELKIKLNTKPAKRYEAGRDERIPVKPTQRRGSL